MTDKLLALQNIPSEDIAKALGKDKIEVVSVLSQAEGGKFLISLDDKHFVLTFTKRAPDKVMIQKALTDELMLQGLPVSRIVTEPATLAGYTTYVSEYLEGTQASYSLHTVHELTVASAKIAKVAYSLFPDTGARHDPRIIYNNLSEASVSLFMQPGEFINLGSDLEGVVAQRLVVDSQSRSSYIHADIKAQNAIVNERVLQIFDFDNLRKDVQLLDLAYLLEDYFLHLGQLDLQQMRQSLDTFLEISVGDKSQGAFFVTYMWFAIIDKLLYSLEQVVSGSNAQSEENLNRRLALWQEGRSKLALEI